MMVIFIIENVRSPVKDSIKIYTIDGCYKNKSNQKRNELPILKNIHQNQKNYKTQEFKNGFFIHLLTASD